MPSILSYYYMIEFTYFIFYCIFSLGYLLLVLLFNIVLKVLARPNRQEKGIKACKLERKK